MGKSKRKDFNRYVNIKKGEYGDEGSDPQFYTIIKQNLWMNYSKDILLGLTAIGALYHLALITESSLLQALLHALPSIGWALRFLLR